VEVAKVKKRTGLTGVRNTQPAKGVRRPASKAKGKTARNSGRKTAKRSAPSKRARLAVVAGKGGKAGKGRKAPPPAPVVRVAIKALDPLRKCGAGTSVQLLYRVDETIDGRSTAHLVFFDRHGWYCEHGRNCPAVGHARKHNGHIARVS
jgi:hypothetical protein